MRPDDETNAMLQGIFRRPVALFRRPFAPALVAWLARLAHPVVDLVFPPSCLACRKAVGVVNGLCPRCWGSLVLVERPFCERLGTPFAVDLGAGALLSPEAIANPPVYGRARAVALFEGPARSLVHRLKYGDRLELAGTMGTWMARAGDDILVEADLLVPIPLHRTRLIARRFNQSALLARAVSAQSGVPVEVESLVRLKATPPQVGLSRTQRGLNVQGAFKVDADKKIAVEGRAIVLVDDVMTSGATANAAARALLRAGARRVDILLFALVAPGT